MDVREFQVTLRVKNKKKFEQVMNYLMKHAFIYTVDFPPYDCQSTSDPSNQILDELK